LYRINHLRCFYHVYRPKTGGRWDKKVEEVFMDLSKIKFTYIRDTPIGQRRNKDGDWKDVPSPRVVTVGRLVEGDQLHIVYAINKVVSPARLRIDPRIRQVMEPGAFRALQKKFRRRFGGDQHCRKSVRAIIREKFRSGKHNTIPHREGHELEDALGLGVTQGGVSISNVCYKASKSREPKQR
jgi:hypothetical protein